MGNYRKHPSDEYLKYLELFERGDFSKAREKLHIAAALKDPCALHTLGYEAETASPPDMKRAIALYRGAAREGFESSMINLARHYERNFNYARYIYWIRKSAEIGSPESKRELRNPLPYLTERAYGLLEKGMISDARRIYKYCSAHGNLQAMINFANIIDTHDKRKNSKLSVSLYTRAMERGSGLAAYNLANHHFDNGNTDGYLKYLNISAELGYAPAKKKLRGL